MYSGILSDMYSGILSDMYSGILSDMYSGILSDMYSGILSDMYSGILSDMYSGILSDIYSGILSDIYSDILSDISSKIPRGRGLAGSASLLFGSGGERCDLAHAVEVDPADDDAASIAEAAMDSPHRSKAAEEVGIGKSVKKEKWSAIRTYLSRHTCVTWLESVLVAISYAQRFPG